MQAYFYSGMYIFFGILILIFILVGIFAILVLKRPPKTNYTESEDKEPVHISENAQSLGRNWIRKNDHGLWEMYIEGSAYERGIINGKLTKSLIYNQEKIFISEIRKKVTNSVYLFFLKLLVAWMNRKLNYYVGDEYNQEIYGISQSASKEFSLIGPGYTRIMNYHAAHDIGHTLQYMNFVGCTSFAVWGNKSTDGKLIHGRNFDFHMGDEFSQDKIVTFYAPDKGYKFAMITWGGMIGTVSGMNIEGIVVTVNAAKSKLPMKSSTPITILVREILQYASSVEESKIIALKRKIFVSESIHVSSAKENSSILIEKTPFQAAYYSPEEQLICTNHFQSEDLKNDPSNLKQIEESSSMARYKRMKQLFEMNDKLSVQTTVEILRDRLGIDDQVVGNGNEIAVNQLIAHHSIVFKPADLKMWICAGPYSIGEYVCYDLNSVFKDTDDIDGKNNIHLKKENIAPDEFFTNGGYTKYIRFKELRNILKITSKWNNDSQELVDEFIHLNPDSYLSYSEAGDLFMKCRQYEKALEYYQNGLQKMIPTKHEKDHIQKGIDQCKRKLKNHNGQ